MAEGGASGGDSHGQKRGGAVTVTVRVMREAGSDPGVALPDYASAGAAGADLRANLEPADRAAGLVLAPMARVLVPTGLRIALPDGVEMQIRPRSGLARNHGVTVANAPGTIDADYRGEIAVILINHGSAAFTLKRGERIAQMVIAKVEQAELVVATSLSETDRGSGGFGSTGR